MPTAKVTVESKEEVNKTTLSQRMTRLRNPYQEGEMERDPDRLFMETIFGSMV